MRVHKGSSPMLNSFVSKFVFTAFIVYCAIPAKAQLWNAPVAEVADYSLQDLAAASYDPRLGVFIIKYNPQVVANVSPGVAAFTRAHEYGHIYRGHVTAGYFATNPLQMLQLGRSAEIDADHYATNIFKDNDEVIDAILEYFESSGSYGDLTHLPHAERARLIRGWAGRKDDDEDRFMVVPCTHAQHPGDVGPCVHACPSIYGPVPCHPSDFGPCVHPAHPNGDRVRRY